MAVDRTRLWVAPRITKSAVEDSGITGAFREEAFVAWRDASPELVAPGTTGRYELVASGGICIGVLGVSTGIWRCSVEDFVGDVVPPGI